MKRGKRICNTLKDVRIQFTNGSVTEYVYSATGQKLGVEYRVAAPNTSVTFGVEPDALTLGQTLYAGSTDYLLGGSLVMTNGKLVDTVYEEITDKSIAEQIEDSLK